MILPLSGCPYDSPDVSDLERRFVLQIMCSMEEKKSNPQSLSTVLFHLHNILKIINYRKGEQIRECQWLMRGCGQKEVGMAIKGQL